MVLCSPPAAARARRAAESGSCGLGAGRGDELTGARRRLMDITTRPTTCSRRGFLKGQSREIVSSFEPTRANDQQFKICSIMVKIWVSYSNLKFGKNYSPREIDSPWYHQTMASQFLPRVSDSGDMDLPGYPTPGRLPWRGIKSRGHRLFNIWITRQILNKIENMLTPCSGVRKKVNISLDCPFKGTVSQSFYPVFLVLYICEAFGSLIHMPK